MSEVKKIVVSPNSILTFLCSLPGISFFPPKKSRETEKSPQDCKGSIPASIVEWSVRHAPYFSR